MVNSKLGIPMSATKSKANLNSTIIISGLTALILMSLIVMFGTDLVHDDIHQVPELGFLSSMALTGIWRIVVR